jgi:hypothetical protein
MPAISRDKLVIGKRYLIVSDTTPNKYRFGTWSTTPAEPWLENPAVETPKKDEFSDIMEYTITSKSILPTDFPGMDRTYSFLEGNESLEGILKGGMPLKGGARKRHKRRTVRKRV